MHAYWIVMPVCIQATSLGCSHTFCALCIAQWFARKRDCPVCRGKVTAQSRAIAFDNYIDNFTDKLSREMKEKRQSLVEERKGTCETYITRNVGGIIIMQNSCRQ